MHWSQRIVMTLMSVLLVPLMMMLQIVQFHHHDDAGNICLCRVPNEHCHDEDHSDCHHNESEDCQVHPGDMIVNDTSYYSVYQINLSFADLVDNLILTSNDSIHIILPVSHHTISSVCGETDIISLRAPPVISWT